MKNKIMKMLTLLICILVFPLVVHADMGMPESAEYKVIVTNKNGAKLYDFDKKVLITIPFDSKLTILYDYDEDGVLYGYVEYNEYYGDVRISDTTIVGNIDFDDFDKLDKPAKLYTLDETYMFHGPSQAYGKIEGVKIPAFTEIEYEYYTEAWAYVSYNGVKGWVLNYPYFSLYDNLDNTVANALDKENTLLTISEVTSLLVKPNEEKKFLLKFQLVKK